MTERKNIDRLFQEKFKDFEVVPRDEVWDKIERELKEKKEKRRVIPFWFRLTGVAAALLIGFFIINKFVNRDTEGNNIVYSNDHARDSSNTVIQSSPNKTSEPQNSVITPATEKNSVVTENDKTKIPAVKVKTSANPVTPAIVESGSSPEIHSIKKHRTDLTNFNQTNPTAIAAGSKNTKHGKSDKILSSDENSALTSNHKPFSIQSNDKGIANKTKYPNSKNLQDKTTPQNNIANQTNNTDNTIAVNKKADSDGKANNTQNNNSTVAIPLDRNNTTVIDPKIAAENIDNKKDTTAIAKVPNALEELMKEKEKNEVTAAEPKLNRWQITTNVAPIYFSSTSNGSPLDSRFEANGKSYKPSISYGAGVKYSVNKKLTIRSGVNTVAMEYDTKDVVFFQTPNARQLENLRSTVQGSLLEIDNKPTEISASVGRIDSKFDGMLNQRTSYVEVPVEMSYTLYNHKLGIDLIGGVSTLILNENVVTLISPGLGINIGEADNLNTVHFSTNVGVGVKYDFLKSFRINFEPMFKYQVNTFSNNAGNFKPYFFGLYTGLSFRF